jgi:hypothetical protein
MARIARVVAPDLPYPIAQRGTGGTTGEMRLVSPQLRLRLAAGGSRSVNATVRRKTMNRDTCFGKLEPLSAE